MLLLLLLCAVAVIKQILIRLVYFGISLAVYSLKGFGNLYKHTRCVCVCVCACACACARVRACVRARACTALKLFDILLLVLLFTQSILGSKP